MVILVRAEASCAIPATRLPPRPLHRPVSPPGTASIIACGERVDFHCLFIQVVLSFCIVLRYARPAEDSPRRHFAASIPASNQYRPIRNPAADQQLPITLTSVGQRPTTAMVPDFSAAAFPAGFSAVPHFPAPLPAPLYDAGGFRHWCPPVASVPRCAIGR